MIMIMISTNYHWPQPVFHGMISSGISRGRARKGVQGHGPFEQLGNDDMTGI